MSTTANFLAVRSEAEVTCMLCEQSRRDFVTVRRKEVASREGAEPIRRRNIPICFVCVSALNRTKRVATNSKKGTGNDKSS